MEKVSIELNGDINGALLAIISTAAEHSETREATQYLLNTASKVHQDMMDNGVENDKCEEIKP